MNPRDAVARRAVQIAELLWPLRTTEATEDQLGTDAVDSATGERVQIKGDRRIVQSGQLYIELYEKTHGRPDQRWRVSPHLCDAYIFVTSGWAWRLTVAELSDIEVRLRAPVVEISETSRGLLIPCREIPCQQWTAHTMWPGPASLSQAVRANSYLPRVGRSA